MNNDLKFFTAPKGFIYIHNERGVESFGEVVVVTDEYPIEDFHLISLEKFNELMAQKKLEVK